VRPRTLYAKILLWFLLTVALTSMLVVLVAGLVGDQPFGRRWMAITQDLYAHSAVDFYTTGGTTALQNYLHTLSQQSAIDGTLLHADGSNTLDMPVSSSARTSFESAKRNGGSAAHLGLRWTAASTVQAPDGRAYVFVMEAHPLRGFIDGTFARALLPRFLLALLVVAAFCMLLARHITHPVLLLEQAALKLAGGDLSVRTRPALRERNDELTRMAEAFDAMAARIETLLQHERETLAEISHELRSPLTRLAVSLELVRRGETDVMDAMDADIERLNSMIGKVLELARLDLETPAESDFAKVNFCELVMDVVEDGNREGRLQDKRITADLSETCHVSGDVELLRSCVENLVRNAVQHSPQGGEVRVSIIVTNTCHLQLEVVDSGPGVPEAALPRLFAPFFRVADSRVADPQGAGLGLAIADRIARLHGGALTARNLQPHGLAVTLALPITT
jgi:two-component system sensor histidine kinase CpxA